MSKVRTCAAWTIVAVCAVQAQTARSVSTSPEDRPHLSLVVERLEDGKWRPLNPQTVLDHGNAIRFQLLTSFSGYLYAYYRGSDGEAEWIYPSPGKETDNRIEAGGSYLIPSASASYIVSGKPGFDTVYWMVSPKSLSGTNDRRPSPPPEGPVKRTIVPMCRADLPGGCFDDRAGAVTVPSAPIAGTLKPREIHLATTGDTTRIEALDGPGLFVYEFLVAHR